MSITMLHGSGAVSPGPEANAYVQDCESGAAGTELVVEQARRVQERPVRFHYRVEDTIKVYGDVVQWHWKLIQLDHPPIVGYDLKVAAPGPMGPPYSAFVHTYDNPQERPGGGGAAPPAGDQVPGRGQGKGSELRTQR